MKKLFLLLTLFSTLLQAQQYQSNVSLASTSSENYYLNALIDTYYPCSEDGTIISKKAIFQIAKGSSGKLTLTNYRWEDEKWVKIGEGVEFNVTNFDKTYFLEFRNAQVGYGASRYTLDNQYLYEYPLSESFVGKDKKFDSTNDYRNFIENNLSNSSLYNKTRKYKKYSANDSNRQALAATAGLILLGALLLGGSNDNNSNSNSGNRYQNNERQATDWDKHGVPIYGPSIREGGYDQNGNKIKN